jgi:glyoxylase-like metal-dependent hydrolase (beta-lactamase superfamily II)
VTDVLMTHHHRDQAQGLPRAVAHGARIWVPPMERDLFAGVEEHWQMRETRNTYNVRQDRYSLLEAVPIAGTLPEYRAPRFGDRHFRIVPTPGHTVGSDSFITEIDGKRVAFTGDLLYGPGKVWSMAATQWTYTGAEGVAASILSLHDLKDRRPDVLLPSHGDPMDDPATAIELTSARLMDVLQFRKRDWRNVMELREDPFTEVTPHLLMDRTGSSNAYVLISDSGAALMIDFGYTANTGLAAGQDRAARRPWLYGLDRLRKHGVTDIEVAVPTHYHDDHVAGLELLRNVIGTKLWIPVNFADILANPDDFDLPCLWYEPIRADLPVPLNVPIRWREYELTFHELPGHTLYAVAISFEVDGKRVLVTGDHQQERWLNYVYKNRFRIDDYRTSADLYRRLAPDLILAGHWDPIAVDDQYLADLAAAGEQLSRFHEALLPLAEIDLGAEGFIAWIRPYESVVPAGEPSDFSVVVHNPFAGRRELNARIVVPQGWHATPDAVRLSIDEAANDVCEFQVVPPAGADVRRARIAVDLTIGGMRFGQHAEALVSVRSAARSVSPELALAAGRGDAFDEVALGEEEDRDHRQRDEDTRREHDLPFALPAATEPVEHGLQAARQRELERVAEIDQRSHEVHPARAELEHEHDDERGLGERERDVPPLPEIARAVDARGLEQLAR